MTENLPIDLSLLKKIWKSAIIRPDSGQIDQILQRNPLLEETLRVRRASLAVIDLSTMKYLRIFGNPLPVTGWTSEELQNGGVNFFMSKLPSNDYAGVEKMSAFLNEYVLGLDMVDLASFKAFFDFRMLRPDGTSRRILHESSALEWDANGNMLFLFGLISDISSLKRNDVQHLRLTNGKEDQIYVVNTNTGECTQLERLSEREYDIVKLIGQMYSSQAIAEKLFLSIHTVNTHRQNMLRKMRMSDMNELVSFLTAYQMI